MNFRETLILLPGSVPTVFLLNLNPIKMQITKYLLVAAVAASTATAQQVMLDTFADGSRSEFTAGTSMPWYSSGGDPAVVDNALQINNSTSRTTVAYFTASQEAKVALDLGEAIQFNLTFSLDGAPLLDSNNFFVGILNSVAFPQASQIPDQEDDGFTAIGDPNTNARVDGDFGSSSPSSFVFGDYQGYMARMNMGTGGGSLRSRVNTNNALFSSSSAWETLSSSGSGMMAPNDEDLVASLTLTRTVDGIRSDYLLTSESGDTVYATRTALDDPPDTFEFDTVGVYMSSSLTEFGLGTLVIDSAEVVVIPEPSTVALIGLGGLALFFFVRRRNR
jgi:hypothetical protein